MLNDSSTLLATLVGFDTTSRHSNLALMSFIEGYLAEHGVNARLIHNTAGTKANLWATLGPADVPGVVLSGHSDVVPVDGQDWSVPPFEMTTRDGRHYGRGTADMKGFLACVLAAVPKMQAATLERPIHIAFSYDEEVGCLGVRSLIEQLPQLATPPMACIIGEPTEMAPVIGHKGKLGVRCHVKGHACHSAYAPDGVNAIEVAADLIGKLVSIGQRLKAQTRDERFSPPFSTVQTGLIQGGQALNIVPEHCSFDWEVRALPEMDPTAVERELEDYATHQLLPDMRAKAPTANIRFERLSAYPGLLTDPDNPVAEWIAALCDSHEFTTVAFGTEGGLFHEAGVPTMVCGPGAMAQGHKPDEYIEVSQLAACDSMLERLVAQLSGR